MFIRISDSQIYKTNNDKKLLEYIPIDYLFHYKEYIFDAKFNSLKYEIVYNYHISTHCIASSSKYSKLICLDKSIENDLYYSNMYKEELSKYYFKIRDCSFVSSDVRLYKFPKTISVAWYETELFSDNMKQNFTIIFARFRHYCRDIMYIISNFAFMLVRKDYSRIKCMDNI